MKIKDKDLFEEYLKIYTNGHFGVGNDNRLHWDNDYEKIWIELGLDVFELRDDGIYEFFTDPEGGDECEWLLRANYMDLEEMDEFIAGNIMDDSLNICSNLGIKWIPYSQFIDEKQKTEIKFKTMTKILLIVDPQNDFVDHRGSLYVPGAESIIMKLCDYIKNHGEKYDHIVVTQDTHRRCHISLSNGWTHKPKPGTKVIKTVNSDFEITAKDSTIIDTMGGVDIWPDHCIIGTWGHCFPDSLVDALSEWEIKKRRGVFYQRKGEDCGYEAFSALTKEQWTGVRPEWRKWEDRDIDVCGFCKDICVAETIKDLVGFGEEKNVTLLSPLSATLNQKSENLEVLKELETSGKIKIIESL